MQPAFIEAINRTLCLLFFLCYSYQFFYILIAHWRKKEVAVPQKLHRYAVLICARNEESVIANLIESIHRQDYPKEYIHIFVAADNCTDRTAAVARACGATVYERFDARFVGKGYALEFLLNRIQQDFPNAFDGFFVFDADNLLKSDYISRMNETFSNGNDLVTSYRNSKNYADNWISAGYGLWFLRESVYLNRARENLGTSCAVSGTGFLFSKQILQECGGWNFHLLTEDIEFSAHNIVHGHRIAFCPEAELYDEQPVTFRQSWRQRLRWAKGYLQVFRKYGTRLIFGIFHGSFSCFDLCMNIMPAFLLSLAALVCNGVHLVLCLLAGTPPLSALWSLLQVLFGGSLILFFLGLLTTITQWKHIRAKWWQKILYTFTFPIFMLTYLPISLQALFCRVEWKPIAHTSKKKIEDM